MSTPIVRLDLRTPHIISLQDNLRIMREEQVRLETIVAQTEVVSALWGVYQFCHSRYALDDLNAGWVELRRLLDAREPAEDWPNPEPMNLITDGAL